jgi:hypothetical protein
MHTRANEIVTAAKSFLDVKYRHQGRTSAGLDCVGLLICIAHTIGLSTFDTIQYSNRPNVNEFTREIIRSGCVQIPISSVGNGDILRLTSHGWPVHLAIFEIDDNGNMWYIHAYLPHKKVTRDPMTPEVWARVSSVWRFPE